MRIRRAASFSVAAGTLLIVLALVPSPDSNRVSAARDCDPAKPHDSGNSDEVLVSGGFGREYILHVPPSYDGETAMPLVLNFHGLGSHAQEQNEYSGLPGKADEEGFILVAPEGTVTNFIPSRHWNFTTLEVFDDTPDDVAFVADLLDKLQDDLCVDTSRIYSTGMSNGAQMSVRLACNLSDRIAAAAPVSGVYYPPAFVEITGEPECASTRSVPLVAFHGARDTIIKFDGGALGLPIPFHSYPVEDKAIPDWAAHLSCDPAPQETPVTTNVRLVRFAGCDADLELYVVEEGRHEWPGARDGGVPEGDEISATDLMWDFFETHSLTGEDIPSSARQSVTGGSSDENVWWWMVGAAGIAAAVIGAGALVLRRRSSDS